MTLVLVFSASACSSEGSSSEKQKSNTGKEETLPPIPKKVFSSNKTNQNISEKEMRQSLKTYLNTHDDIFKNAEKIRNKDKLNKNSESVDVSLEDANKINKINDQYKKEVNGKKQNEVEKFLKNKNIKTKAFK